MNKRLIELLYPQLFADGDDGGDDQSDQKKQDDSSGEKGDDEKKTGEPKSYTQDELDKMIAKRVKRAEDKAADAYKNSDDYKAFEKYQIDALSDKEKVDKKLEGMTELEKKFAAIQAENASLKNQKTLSTGEVNKEFVDYVMFEVNKSVDDDIDFETAFDNFKKDENNEKYFAVTKDPKKPQSHRHGGTGGGEESDVKSRVDRLYGAKK